MGKKLYRKPPEELYYCTPSDDKVNVTNEGLESVILYDDVKYMIRNKVNDLDDLVIFRIDSGRMYKENKKFYQTSKKGWGTNKVLPKYISLML